jgi:5-methylcytosine-specific restriction endonuclease McrA
MTRIGNIDPREAKRIYVRERARRLRKDPEYRKLERERNERWATANREQALESKRVAGRKWYRKNRQRKLAQNKRWKAAHPDLVRLYQAKRVQISSILKRASRLSREYAMVLYRDPCAYCGAPATTVDHIVSSDAGGENHWTNFTGACGSCNSSKGTTPLLEFLCR